MKKELFLPGMASVSALIQGFLPKQKHKKERPVQAPVKVRGGRKGKCQPISVRGSQPFTNGTIDTSQPDLRHDKYLHRSARLKRRAAWTLEHPEEKYPYDRPRYRFALQPFRA